MQMEIMADEVVAVLRDMYPREFQTIMLTISNSKLSARIEQLEAERERQPHAHKHDD